jgi:hypothetical protein
MNPPECSWPAASSFLVIAMTAEDAPAARARPAQPGNPSGLPPARVRIALNEATRAPAPNFHRPKPLLATPLILTAPPHDRTIPA